MAVTYTTAVKNARLNAVTTAIGTTGVLEIGTTGMGTVLATITLSEPSATVSGASSAMICPALKLRAASSAFNGSAA